MGTAFLQWLQAIVQRSACNRVAKEWRTTPQNDKVIANSRLAKLNLRDLISVGLVDASWATCFPQIMAELLLQILDDPEG
jgi:hypothetical protein